MEISSDGLENSEVLNPKHDIKPIEDDSQYLHHQVDAIELDPVAELKRDEYQVVDHYYKNRPSHELPCRAHLNLFLQVVLVVLLGNLKQLCDATCSQRDSSESSVRFERLTIVSRVRISITSCHSLLLSVVELV